MKACIQVCLHQQPIDRTKSLPTQMYRNAQKKSVPLKDSSPKNGNENSPFNSKSDMIFFICRLQKKILCR